MNRHEGRRWLIVIWIIFAAVTVALEGTASAITCNECHGTRNPVDYRPVDDESGARNDQTGGFEGNHRTHMPTPVTGSSAPCAVCHQGSDKYGSSHMNRRVDISFNINSSPSPAKATYSKGVFFNQTTVTAAGTCSNVNCHFEKPTPSWGGPAAQADCTTCHSAPPGNGAHGKKHGEYFGTGTDSCSKCHSDHTKETNPLAHALDAGKRPLNVQFTTSPNSGGTYSGDVSYPKYLPSQNPPLNGTCTNLYCHSDGMGGAPTVSVRWSDTSTTRCFSCHRGTTTDNTEANCNKIGGKWGLDAQSNTWLCRPYVNMTSYGHKLLVGPQWIRQYPCTYCHNGTVDAAGNIINIKLHVNGKKDIRMAPQWAITNKSFPTYTTAAGTSVKKCYNVYCHSDGTTNPTEVKPFAWTEGRTKCNSCHGHPTESCSNGGCHDGTVHADDNRLWPVFTRWTTGEEWKAAIPMFPNQGAGTERANSHARHTESDFTCDKCHSATIRTSNGTCNGAGCHTPGQPLPTGNMGTISHLNGTYHVNKAKDVVFKDGGTYKPNKSCSGTKCHSGEGNDPVWGGSVNSDVICRSCHGTTGPDVDAFVFITYSTQAKINLTEWQNVGHGRYSSLGPYPVSGNPPAKFPGNPCWYCHDNKVLHNDSKNLFRLRMHPQFERRFEKECVYCHMEHNDAECLSCHVNQAESLAPQATSGGIVFKKNGGTTETRYTGHSYLANCISGTSNIAGECHDTDNGTFASGAHKGHGTNAGAWAPHEKADIKNQYMMMGVCLQCHDDDSNNKCTQCHTPPENNPKKYSIGFDPGTGFIKPKKARATSAHFGYKHYRQFKSSGGWQYVGGKWKAVGTWRGGKFCWDCHDPHGDKNIYMIHTKVATSTDGTFGIPQTREAVSFTRKAAIGDGGYARNQAPYNGICNVCHTPDSKHFTSEKGDSHGGGRICSGCHEHRFSDSHASGQSCNTDECHSAKPIPRHSAFGQPRDCTKCHTGAINQRMNIMSQMKSNSHHVQGVTVNNKHCYACHWESTPQGLIDVRYHEGYDYKLYTSVKNAKVDLVVWGPKVRPTYYNTTTAVQFLASNMGTTNERSESAKLTNVCLSCHSDQNNDTQSFKDYTDDMLRFDCRTPRQYAWDGQSIAARYSQTGTTPWGKYNSATYPNITKKDKVTKAFSAHGNAAANQGGWDPVTGLDGAIPNTRNGSQNVQCFDCHSSHGSTTEGVTSSYVTFNGTRNGANLKETQENKGGYKTNYKASANPDTAGINPYAAGAGQCFDCHLTATSGLFPWGYNSTFGAASPIKGYSDSDRFGAGAGTQSPGVMQRSAMKGARSSALGGHLKATSFLNYTASERINGLCTPCHDPHGVSPTLGANQKYAVPLLKGTWITSPYKEDAPAPKAYGASALNEERWGQPNSSTVGYRATPEKGGTSPEVKYNIDRTAFGGNNRIPEDATKFAGLCMRCHQKAKLTDGTPNNTAWKSIDRIHESVKGWGDTSKVTEHSYTCSKCHTPHTSGLPRLMVTNCLDYKHRGDKTSGGNIWRAEISNPGNGHADIHGVGNQHRGFPIGNVYGNTPDYEATSSCHGRAQGSGSYPGNSRWNDKTPW